MQRRQRDIFFFWRSIQRAAREKSFCGQMMPNDMPRDKWDVTWATRHKTASNMFISVICFCWYFWCRRQRWAGLKSRRTVIAERHHTKQRQSCFVAFKRTRAHPFASPEYKEENDAGLWNLDLSTIEGGRIVKGPPKQFQGKQKEG